MTVVAALLPYFGNKHTPRLKQQHLTLYDDNVNRFQLQTSLLLWLATCRDLIGLSLVLLILKPWRLPKLQQQAFHSTTHNPTPAHDIAQQTAILEDPIQEEEAHL